MKLLTKKKISVLISAVMLITTVAIPNIMVSAAVTVPTNIATNPGFDDNKTGWWGGVQNRALTNAALLTIVTDSTTGNKYATSYAGLGYCIGKTLETEQNTSYMVKFKFKGAGAVSVGNAKRNAQAGVADENLVQLNPINYNTSQNSVRGNNFSNDSTQWTEHIEYFNSREYTQVFIEITDMGSTKICIDDMEIYEIDPQVDTATVAGFADVGRKVKINAKIYDFCGDSVGIHEVQWKRGESATGPWTEIIGATDHTYEIKGEDVGKYISYDIIPVTVNSALGRKEGAISQSQAIYVQSPTQYIALDLSAHFTGKLITTQEESFYCTSAKDNIDRYTLKSESFTFGASNEFMCGGVPYAIDVISDRRAIHKNGDVTISLGGETLSKLHVLMAYAQAPADLNQTAVVTYNDDTTQDVSYTAGLIAEKTEIESLVNNEPYGMNGVGNTDDDLSRGFLYSYEFDLDNNKEAKTITFPLSETEGKAVIFAVTAEALSGEELKAAIEAKIAQITTNISSATKEKVQTIMRQVERYAGAGNDATLIEGYSVVSGLLIEVANATLTNENTTAKITVNLTNPVKAEDINYDNIKVNGYDSSKYYFTFTGETTDTFEINVINDFNYSGLNLTIDRALKCANAPYFTLDEDFRKSFTQTKVNEITVNQPLAINGTNVSGSIDYKYNGTGSTTYQVYIIVYGANNKMLYANTAYTGTLSQNQTVDIDINETIPSGAQSVNMFILDGANTMQILYR